jgi:2-methylisocitrate lyase-like PEP mutase family enzyme
MPGSRPSTADKRKTFRKLHEAGCFVIPNPWNVGSARYLQGLGFKALATTSAGHAHAQGFADGAQSRDDVLAHYRELAAATDVPLNADFENGFADDPAGVADSVTRCIETGVAGLSIEDSRASKRRARRSTAPAARWCSPRGRKISFAACPISTTPFDA